MNITPPKYLLLAFFLLMNVTLNAKSGRQIIDSLVTLPHNMVYSKPKEFIPIFQNWIEISQKIKYKLGTAKLYSKLSLAYAAISESASSRDAEIKAIKLFEEMHSYKELIHEYGLYGYHLLKTNLELAKYYIQLAMNLAQTRNAKQELCVIYGYYSTVLEQSGKLDSALYFSEKGLDIKYEIADIVGIPYSLNNLAGIHARLGNMDKAFKCMEESDKYRAKEGEDYGRAENAVILGELYLEVKKYEPAIKKFCESLTMAKIMGNKFMVQYNYEKLSEVYKKMGNYQAAFQNLKKYKSYQDSILNTETNQKIAELEIKFESEKKDKELTVAQFQLKEQRGQLIATGTISIILLIGAIGGYRFQKYKRKQIKNELELKHKLAKVELETKISEEKLRISRELHDNIGSQLTFMVSSLDNLTYVNKGGMLVSKLTALSDFGRNTLNDLRQTIWIIKKNKSTLTELLLRINEFNTQISTKLQINLTNNAKDEIILTSMQTLNVFRVIQEALQNTMKYANAQKINIIFSKNGNTLQLYIRDDGNGFNISTTRMGNGIYNMKYRCEEAGGSFEIISNKSGTTIKCNMPIEDFA